MQGSDIKDRPSREEALEAVKTLLGWIGYTDDSNLLSTPETVVSFYESFFFN